MKKFTLWLLFAFCALVANADEAYTIYLKIDGTNVTESSTVKIHVWDCTKNYTDGNDWPNKLPVLSDIVTDNDGTKYYTYQLEDNNANFNFLYIFDGNQKGNFNATGNVISSYDGNSVTNTPGSPNFTKVYLYGDNYYEKWEAGVKLEYNSTEAAYVYTETTPANLASKFKILIDGKWYRYEKYEDFDLLDNKKNNTRTYEEIKEIGDKDMTIKDAANFSSITIKVKKDGNVWKMQVEGTPTGGGGSEGEDHTVTMKGDAWSWTGDKFTFTKQGDGTYAYTFKGNDKAGLAHEFAFTIDGKDYSNSIDLEVNTDVAYPMATGQYKQNYKITSAAYYTDITLTVAFSNGTPSLKVTGTKAEKVYPATVTIVGAMKGWHENVYTIDHKGNGIYEGKFDTSTTNGLWRIYEQWDSSKGNSNDNWDNGTSWGYEGNQSGDNTSGTFTRGKKDNANTTTKRLWWLIFDINTGAWKLRESTSGVESIDNEGVKIVAGKGTITVSGATNVEVYTAGGALVSREAESHVAAGLYIVRTDNKVAKVIVR